MAVQASKIISLTNYATGGTFRLSANKIVKFTASGGHTLLTYINRSGHATTLLVTESVSTINTAAARTQAVTLDDATSTVMYIHSDNIIYLTVTTAGTDITYYDAVSDKPIIFQVTTAASAINTAAGNTFAITLQPANGVTGGTTQYINNLFVDALYGEAAGTPPVITFTSKVKTGTGSVTTAGSGYTSLVASITGGGGSGATGTVSGKAISAIVSAPGTAYVAGISVITITGGTSATASKFNVTETQLITTAVNAAGTGYVPGEVITLAGGTHSVTATTTVTDTQVVSATVATGGTGNIVDGAGVIVQGTTGTGTKFRASVTIATNAIASVQSITVAGDYTVNPTLITAEPVTYVSGGGGGTILTGAQLSVVMGVLTNVVAASGTYTVNAASFTQGSTTGIGTGATFNTVVYGVRTLTVNTAGDYSVLPTNPAAQGSATGGGTGATLTVSWGILAFTITGAGTGFTSYPTFAVTGAGGSSAVITAGMTVESPMTLVSGGANLLTAPTLTFSAGTSTATATATLDATTETVTGTTLTAAGSYIKGTDVYPTLSISGGTGCLIVYDSKRPEFDKIDVEETITTVTTAINAL